MFKRSHLSLKTQSSQDYPTIVVLSLFCSNVEYTRRTYNLVGLHNPQDKAQNSKNML